MYLDKRSGPEKIRDLKEYARRPDIDPGVRGHITNVVLSVEREGRDLQQTLESWSKTLASEAHNIGRFLDGERNWHHVNGLGILQSSAMRIDTTAARFRYASDLLDDLAETYVPTPEQITERNLSAALSTRPAPYKRNTEKAEWIAGFKTGFKGEPDPSDMNLTKAWRRGRHDGEAARLTVAA